MTDLYPLAATKNCSEALNVEGHKKDGLYLYQSIPKHHGHKIVFCTVIGSRGYVVIQRRINNDVNFYRDWDEYEQGFGNLEGNFWIGLAKLHFFASRGKKAILRVEVKYSSDPNVYFAEYKKFTVKEKGTNYQLVIGDYSGNAGDALSLDHDGQQFTTYDRDHDEDQTKTCAQKHKGGWWYSRCHKSNLNGLYPVNGNEIEPQYMTWYHLRYVYGGIVYSQMSITYNN